MKAKEAKEITDFNNSGIKGIMKEIQIAVTDGYYFTEIMKVSQGELNWLLEAGYKVSSYENKAGEWKTLIDWSEVKDECGVSIEHLEEVKKYIFNFNKPYTGPITEEPR